ncbi:MAG: ribonuclease H [Oligoflexia bacterium]|nr:ribonuclease H [Oligoflexia bacterium]
MNLMLKAYVDGSYRDGRVGWATVIVKNSEVVDELSGELADEEVQGTRQVAGELMAVQKTIEWCNASRVKGIEVHYDYKGIECWVTGEWKAKLPLTQNYRDFVRLSKINIKWIKVKSHSGDKFNDRADELACKAICGF